MQENKKVEKKGNKLTDNNKKGLKSLIIALQIIMLIITVSVIIVIYLHNSRFRVVFNQMKLDNYFSTNNINQAVEVKDNTVTIELSSDVITTSFNNKIKQLKPQNGYKILDGYINTNSKKAFINANIYGINIPIAMDIILEVNKRDVNIKFDNLTLRNKKMLSIPSFVEESIKNKFINDVRTLTINLDDYRIPSMASISKVSFGQNNIVLVLTIDNNKLKKEMQKLNVNRSQELYNIYRNDNNNETRQKVVKIMDNLDNLSNIEIEEILKDVLILEEKLMKNILTISDEKDIDNVLNVYGKYITHFNKKTISNDKNKLILGKIEKYCNELLDQVDKLPRDEYIIFMNNPYSLEDNTIFTIKDLVDKYQIEITQEIYSKMSFLYNYNSKNYMISYKVDDNQYAIIEKDNYRFIDKREYMKYLFDKPLEEKLVLDNDIKAIIDTYFSSNSFIRYMKSDGKYAYVIASDEKNYQDYEKFALEKKKSWEIIKTNITDMYEFSINNPGFNIKTLTDDFLSDAIYELSEDDKFAILDQLEYRKVIEDKSKVGLEYCSYDGKYIAVKLTNKEEYVFLIKYSYLDKLYKKDIAIKKWKDISPLILLQDSNQEN